MFDHIGINVSDLEASKEFYEKTLKPLGVSLAQEVDGWVGFGEQGKATFWISMEGEAHEPMHIAFKAGDRAAVDAFYEAALDAGAVCNGKPGVRDSYHANYYGAFVIDPDGHNIEAVCHQP
ncbi:VOC family protein [Gallaecimonas sp. GXIMD4217]|uniref:VOC family protein n=1 Tax=Gallaecimonas sp. GXIMD4217 TaxID=3131927 RepID=UPI00311B3F0E